MVAGANQQIEVHHTKHSIPYKAAPPIQHAHRRGISRWRGGSLPSQQSLKVGLVESDSAGRHNGRLHQDEHSELFRC